MALAQVAVQSPCCRCLLACLPLHDSPENTAHSSPNTWSDTSVRRSRNDTGLSTPSHRRGSHQSSGQHMGRSSGGSQIGFQDSIHHLRDDSVSPRRAQAYDSWRSRQVRLVPNSTLQQLMSCFHSLNGWGASLVDSLDTMVLMGLDDIVERSLVHVAKLELDKVRASYASVPSLLTRLRTKTSNFSKPSFVTSEACFLHMRSRTTRSSLRVQTNWALVYSPSSIPHTACRLSTSTCARESFWYSKMLGSGLMRFRTEEDGEATGGWALTLYCRSLLAARWNTATLRT